MPHDRAGGANDVAAIQLLRPDGLVKSPAFSHVAASRRGPPPPSSGLNAVDDAGTIVSDDVSTQVRRYLDNHAVAGDAAGAFGALVEINAIAAVPA